MVGIAFVSPPQLGRCDQCVTSSKLLTLWHLLGSLRRWKVSWAFLVLTAMRVRLTAALVDEQQRDVPPPKRLN